MITTRTCITARSAWRPSDFPDRGAYSVALSDAHLAAFDSALAVNRAAGRAPEEIIPDGFARGAIGSAVPAWRDEVLHGRGFVVLRGLSRDRYSPDDLAAIFWALGTHLGRAYRTSRELTLHTDRCDVIGCSA